MNAVEFVKKLGIDYAIKVLNYDQSIASDVCQLDFCEFENLKQIVDAFELVGDDLEYTKRFYADCAFKKDKHLRELKKAINLVEQCQ